jgi:hypothetical protein
LRERIVLWNGSDLFNGWLYNLTKIAVVYRSGRLNNFAILSLGERWRSQRGSSYFHYPLSGKPGSLPLRQRIVLWNGSDLFNGWLHNLTK